MIDFEGEEEVEENKDVKEACEWGFGVGCGGVSGDDQGERVREERAESDGSRAAS